MTTAEPEHVVLDASALVDVLAATPRAGRVRERIAHTKLHAPAHFDAEVLSALARLSRAGERTSDQIQAACVELAAAPVIRHPLPDLLVEAWRKRERIRVLDALYVALAEKLDVLVISTDARLCRTSEQAECV